MESSLLITVLKLVLLSCVATLLSLLAGLLLMNLFLLLRNLSTPSVNATYLWIPWISGRPRSIAGESIMKQL